MGLKSKIAEKKQKWWWRWPLQAGNKILGWENMMNFWIKIDSKAEEEDWGTASKELISKLGIELDTGEDLERIRKNKKATLVLGVNHEAILEPFIIASLLGDRRVSLISLKVLQVLGRAYSKYIMPVMPRRYAKDEKRFKRWIVNKVHPRARLYGIEELKVVEIDEMNEKVFNRAAKRLMEGMDVVLFATGGKVAQAAWGRGLGEIVNRVSKEKRSDVQIAFFHFDGLRQMEVVKRFWMAANGKKLKKINVRVNCHKGFELSRIEQALGERFEPKSIVEYIKAWSLEKFGYNKVRERNMWKWPKLVYQPVYARLMTIWAFVRMRI